MLILAAAVASNLVITDVEVVFMLTPTPVVPEAAVPLRVKQVPLVAEQEKVLAVAVAPVRSIPAGLLAAVLLVVTPSRVSEPVPTFQTAPPFTRMPLPAVLLPRMVSAPPPV